MPNTKHAKWLRKQADALTSSDGRRVDVYELVIDESDESSLSTWAKHFREHYCLDAHLDALLDGTGAKTRAEYLRDYVFPDSSDDFGPATRSGDFAEIMIADLLEHHLGFWAPRTRYSDKLVRNESPKGTDVLAFKLHKGSPAVPSRNDTVITFETKAQLTGKKYLGKLQEAVNDSSKDAYRLAEALNATKRRLLMASDLLAVERVKRFQDGTEVPYRRLYGAAAVLSSSVYDKKTIGASTDCSNHEDASKLVLIVVHGHTLMQIVHALYERAANEA